MAEVPSSKTICTWVINLLEYSKTLLYHFSAEYSLFKSLPPSSPLKSEELKKLRQYVSANFPNLKSTEVDMKKNDQVYKQNRDTYIKQLEGRFQFVDSAMKFIEESIQIQKFVFSGNFLDQLLNPLFPAHFVDICCDLLVNTIILTRSLTLLQPKDLVGLYTILCESSDPSPTVTELCGASPLTLLNSRLKEVSEGIFKVLEKRITPTCSQYESVFSEESTNEYNDDYDESMNIDQFVSDTKIYFMSDIQCYHRLYIIFLLFPGFIIQSSNVSLLLAHFRDINQMVVCPTQSWDLAGDLIEAFNKVIKSAGKAASNELKATVKGLKDINATRDLHKSRRIYLVKQIDLLLRWVKSNRGSAGPWFVLMINHCNFARYELDWYLANYLQYKKKLLMVSNERELILVPQNDTSFIDLLEKFISLRRLLMQTESISSQFASQLRIVKLVEFERSAILVGGKDDEGIVRLVKAMRTYPNQPLIPADFSLAFFTTTPSLAKSDFHLVKWVNAFKHLDSLILSPSTYLTKCTDLVNLEEMYSFIAAYFKKNFFSDAQKNYYYAFLLFDMMDIIISCPHRVKAANIIQYRQEMKDLTESICSRIHDQFQSVWCLTLSHYEGFHKVITPIQSFSETHSLSESMSQSMSQSLSEYGSEITNEEFELIMMAGTLEDIPICDVGDYKLDTIEFLTSLINHSALTQFKSLFTQNTFVSPHRILANIRSFYLSLSLLNRVLAGFDSHGCLMKLYDALSGPLLESVFKDSGVNTIIDYYSTIITKSITTLPTHPYYFFSPSLGEYIFYNTDPALSRSLTHLPAIDSITGFLSSESKQPTHVMSADEVAALFDLIGPAGMMVVCERVRKCMSERVKSLFSTYSTLNTLSQSMSEPVPPSETDKVVRLISSFFNDLKIIGAGECVSELIRKACEVAGSGEMGFAKEMLQGFHSAILQVAIHSNTNINTTHSLTDLLPSLTHSLTQLFTQSSSVPPLSIADEYSEYSGVSVWINKFTHSLFHFDFLFDDSAVKTNDWSGLSSLLCQSLDFPAVWSSCTLLSSLQLFNSHFYEFFRGFSVMYRLFVVGESSVSEMKVLNQSVSERVGGGGGGVSGGGVSGSGSGGKPMNGRPLSLSQVFEVFVAKLWPRRPTNVKDSLPVESIMLLVSQIASATDSSVVPAHLRFYLTMQAGNYVSNSTDDSSGDEEDE